MYFIEKQIFVFKTMKRGINIVDKIILEYSLHKIKVFKLLKRETT